MRRLLTNLFVAVLRLSEQYFLFKFNDILITHTKHRTYEDLGLI